MADSTPHPSSCAALPLVNSAGTSVTCTTAADRDARIAATGATAAASGTKDTGKKGKGGKKGSGGKKSGGAKASGTAVSSAAPPTETGGNNAASGDATGDPQKSLTLSKDSIQANYSQDGSQG